MHDDLVELLELLSRAGRIADRMLARIQAETAPAVEVPPEPSEPVVTLVAQPEPERESEPERLTLPPDFRIGSPAFEDKWPDAKRWFTRHAMEMLIERHGIVSGIAYRTMQHVKRQLDFGRALFLYEDGSGHVWAVTFFGRVAPVVTDATASTIITFYPVEALSNGEILRKPKVRAQLHQMISDARSAYEARKRA